MDEISFEFNQAYLLLLVLVLIFCCVITDMPLETPYQHSYR